MLGSDGAGSKRFYHKFVKGTKKNKSVLNFSMPFVPLQ